MTAVFILTLMVGFAILSAIVASNKNRSVLGWALIGFLFTLFGFLAALVVSEVEENEQSSRRKSRSKRGGKKSAAQEFDPDEHEKKCPMCAEYIKLEARRCKHCGHETSEEEVERQVKEKKKEAEEKREMSREERRAAREELIKAAKERKNPEDLEEPPPDEIAARCGECHYPLREGEERCPRCQKEVVWS